MVNSVNGKLDSMESVFPLIQKYGAVVVGLCLDESGIPSTSKERLVIAQKIVKRHRNTEFKKGYRDRWPCDDNFFAVGWCFGYAGYTTKG